jgi:hypothetical protein
LRFVVLLVAVDGFPGMSLCALSGSGVGVMVGCIARLGLRRLVKAKLEKLSIVSA